MVRYRGATLPEVRDGVMRLTLQESRAGDVSQSVRAAQPVVSTHNTQKHNTRQNKPEGKTNQKEKQ